MADSVVASKKKPPIYSALRHRNYRWYWIGSLIYVTGFMIQMLAQSWLIWQLTHSPIYLGLVGLFNSVPTIALSLFGGVLADRVDRRKLLIVTQSASMVLVAVLAILIGLDIVNEWHVLTVAAAQGAVMAFDQPTRQALIANLVPKEDLMNAIALGSAIWNSARIIGPAIAGVMIEMIGVAGCYYVTAFTFLGMLAALAAITVPPRDPQAGSSSVARNISEGIGYIRREPVFFALIGMTFFNSIFGMAYLSLMPVFATDILSVGSAGMGTLMGASGIGALLGTICIAWLGDFRRKGVLLLVTSSLFGVLIALFASSQWFTVSVGFMLASGALNAMYMTTTNTVLQAMVPDQLRGRVMSVYGMTWSLMPLGGLQAGAIAQFFGAPFAVGLGGLIVSGFAIFAGIRLPYVRRL